MNKDDQDIRSKINVLSLIEALENHIIHGVEMSSTQVNAALALLKKTLPDLQSSTQDKNKKTAAFSHEDFLEELE